MESIRDTGEHSEVLENLGVMENFSNSFCFAINAPIVSMSNTFGHITVTCTGSHPALRSQAPSSRVSTNIRDWLGIPGAECFAFCCCFALCRVAVMAPTSLVSRKDTFKRV